MGLRHLRRIAVLNADRDEIFTVPAFPKPAYIGARNSLRSQPAVSLDFIGSTSATTR
jgi:hypothetical protein